MSRSRTSKRPSPFELALAAGLALALCAPAAGQPVAGYQIVPSAADPRVHDFNEPSLALTGSQVRANAPLALFLTGTGGHPATGPRALYATIADQGYRVLALEYDDMPAVAQVCPRDPDPACSADFREMRIYGTGRSRTVSNPPAEGIVARLVAALRALDRQAPGQGWGAYLDGDQPRWDRILVSGLSQGAGMAAFIAKRHLVYRVVLFSSPWDWTGPDRHPAPWLSGPSATPMDRWQAEYHRRERTADNIAAAYRVLGIPADHIYVFNRDLPRNAPDNGNPYHGSTVRDPGYEPQWRAMYGRAP
jgi:hypothetical protein